jgi:ankyrin repeat protein
MQITGSTVFNLRGKLLGGHSLLYAIELGNSKEVKAALEEGADPSAPVALNRSLKEFWYAPMVTPLKMAIEKGDLTIIQLLLQYGAKLDYQDEDGRTPLHYAVSYGKEEIIRALLVKNTFTGLMDKNGRTPLKAALEKRHFHLVQLLAQFGARIDHQDVEGKTPLHYAVASNDIESVRMLIGLLKAGSKFNIQDKLGRTLVHERLIYLQNIPENEEKEDPILQLVLPLVSVAIPDSNGQVPLHYAAERGDLRLIQSLHRWSNEVNCADYNYRTPLHIASEKLHLGAVEQLCLYGADVNAPYMDISSEFLTTALHHCMKQLLLDDKALQEKHYKMAMLLLEFGAYFGESYVQNKPSHTERDDGVLFSWILEYYQGEELLRELKKLLDLGGNPNGFIKNKPILHLAIDRGLEEAVRILIEEGASVHSLDGEGDSSLHRAVKAHSTYLVKMLLEKGARLQVQNREKQMPLDVARKIRNLAIAYQIMNADPFDKSLSPQGEDSVKGGITPLHACIQKGQIEELEELLEDIDCDPNALDSKGQTPLDIAIQVGNPDAIKILLQYGANCGRTFPDTPLNLISEKSTLANILELFIRQMSISFYSELTPLHRAARGDNEEAIKKFAEVDPLFSLHLKRQTLNGATPLTLAVAYDRALSVGALLCRGAQLNYKNYWGDTDLCLAIRTGAIHCMIELLRHGADPNIPGLLEETPVYAAAKYQRWDLGKEMLIYLVAYGAKLDARLIRRPKATGQEHLSYFIRMWESNPAGVELGCCKKVGVEDVAINSKRLLSASLLHRESCVSNPNLSFPSKGSLETVKKGERGKIPDHLLDNIRFQRMTMVGGLKGSEAQIDQTDKFQADDAIFSGSDFNKEFFQAPLIKRA